MSKKILHIEDNESIRILVKEIISKEYEYVGVPTAEEGLEIIKKEDVNLVILDLKLPGIMQGTDLIEKLKELGIDTKIIPVTASPPKIKKLLNKYPHLVVRCILKPFDSERLMNTIRKVLNGEQ